MYFSYHTRDGQKVVNDVNTGAILQRGTLLLQFKDLWDAVGITGSAQLLLRSIFRYFFKNSFFES